MLQLSPHSDRDAPGGSADDAAIVRFASAGKRFAAPDGGAEFVALEDIDLTVSEGSITGIIGRSGAGKSTLIRMVNGLERPSSGHVIVDGIDVAAMDERKMRTLRRSVGMIFQHFNLLSARTAYANVALPLEIAGVSKAEIAKRVTPLLELVGIADKRDRYPAEMSGGQKQRVGIARALATNPKVLLSDEATSALDPETTRSVLALLKQVNRELGLTVLLITHEMQVVREIADHVAVLDRGRIVEKGDTYSVFARPQHPVTRTFLEGVTGVRLPAFVTEKMTSEPEPDAEAVVKIVFTGPTATDPILAEIGKTLATDVNILAGAVDEIAGKPFGTLVVALDQAALAPAQALIEERGLTSEVLGYVR
ncbi:D-methionine transport system ATP-binding protein [Rhodopseudomonas julia]|uniref:D-methionine transport system ATP-binding protein n=1 Tax=Rhodopseudomonas julia TaxID=200617 RepID=A0ABU0C6D0_9BRAD|nr:methionine ABC transporter ATP-binding protein [Rhodopseudomonas julia]MDQ0326082.1 D-methionine transport system ATP-binding protein [Rhodopseudomonas julia]